MNPIYACGRGGGVVFLTDFDGRHTVNGLIDIAPRLKIGAIDNVRLPLAPSFKARLIIVADVERRSPGNEERLGATVKHWQTLPNGPLVLNAPNRPMRRFELLKTLYQMGQNKKSIFRLDDPSLFDVVRFPCFIRDENGHNVGKDAPVLLHTIDDLKLARQELLLSGASRLGWVVVEFEDTRDEDGFYIKYSYYRVGDKLIASHRFASDHWFVKMSAAELTSENPQITEREHAFIEAEQYQADIASIFKLAGIEYGRIDFGIGPEGNVHVFEINTNPHHPKANAMHASRAPFIKRSQRQVIDELAALSEDRETVKLKWPRDAFWSSIQERIVPF